MFEKRLLIKRVLHLLKEDYKNWTFDQCRAKHSSGFSIWLVVFPSLENPDITISLVDMFRINRAVHKCKCLIALDKLKQ